jgi:hypothetical protein
VRALALIVALVATEAGAFPADAPVASAQDSGQGESKPLPQQPSMDFDLLPPAPKSEVNPELEAQVRKRRAMLQWHQGLGLAMLGTLGATVVVGQLDFNDKFRGGGDTDKWQTPHLVLASASTVLFTSVALLGVLAPNPYPKKAGWDTATIHKVLMTAATAGMLAQMIIGLAAPAQNGSTLERDLAGVHQVLGYTTLALTTAGAVVYVF